MGRLFDGACRLCGEDYKGQGITSHVKRCLAEHANEAAIHHGLLVGIRADGYGGRYWMYVLVKPEASLQSLDGYLREAWLECCDHPSVFDIEDEQYLSSVPAEGADDAPVESMNVDIGAVLRPRMEFGYLYDPTCPTEVELTVYDPYPCPAALVEGAEDTDVTTVARNTITAPPCSTCDNAAELICPSCASQDEPEVGIYACRECRSEHESELLPIVNSPRMGVCQYTGGLDETS